MTGKLHRESIVWQLRQLSGGQTRSMVSVGVSFLDSVADEIERLSARLAEARNVDNIEVRCTPTCPWHPPVGTRSEVGTRDCDHPLNFRGYVWACDCPLLKRPTQVVRIKP